ncbi:tRNA (guanosine(37)-N1)-methyltransferase TrmD [Mobiluncus curtisii]|uniref:tRNA (guanosine(37)-N1)-methyltransferase TrmD n=1 Tax=Mobiluncus curtisii TaxID=2051 RepID=UPI0014703FE3|nr:tRNA (guanosine(37)-N1)-methyltransferase TrmD [Mobiluncus curtisii]NMW46093.1 tRNA (guanosine(37)-N1)-methyltransferase TrmD [Mobiluncus curtisii]
MRFQILTIFPEFFEVLGLSLLGKAAQNGVLSWDVTNLRDFTDDPHRSVDDTPYGGGAGMVMRADIWGKAIDAARDRLRDQSAGSDPENRPTDLVNPKTILAIPTPSGIPLTQAKVREIAAHADNVIIACGRYEGIDSRVASHYNDPQLYPDLEVFEYSLGDYVLNGGEIAAVALIEAVGRLLDGMVGNPESLVEESYEGTGLLEYPCYTRPEIWRDLAVPEVLKGGNHAAIEAWRRERAIEKTCSRRPDLLASLDVGLLSKRGREKLASLGWLYVSPQDLEAIGLSRLCETRGIGGAQKDTADLLLVPLRIRQPNREEALALSALGSETFPLACPAYLSNDAIAQFVAVEFDTTAVKARLNTPQENRYWVAELGGELVGYTYAKVGLDESEVDQAGIVAGDAYLSKCYVREALHSTGLSGALLEVAVQDLASTSDAPGVCLGTSIYNKRAQKFYKHHGFRRIGKRTFTVGDVQNQDVVMRRVFDRDNA